MSLHWLRVIAFCLFAGGTAVAHAGAPVEVVALFKDRIVIRTAAGQEMLKVGETSKNGVKLLQADTRGAKVQYQNDTFELSLTDRVASSFTKPAEEVVHINRDQLGQYRMGGTINGHQVNFLVDTGASVVAMSERHAVAMGLDYQSGQRGYVQTAQGNANSYFLLLDEVTLGGITQHQVRATVIEGTFPVDVLLGMSFLGGVRLNDEAGVLTLTAKF